MKKIFKSRIFAFVLGAILFGGIGVVSAYTILANNIGYTPKDTTWKKTNGEDITNVKDAIDDLYDKTNNKSDLLWINNNKTTGISAFDVNVNLSNYTKIMVVGYYDTWNSPYELGFYSIINVGESKTMRCTFKTDDYNTRDVTVSENKVSFSNGKWKSTDCTECLIPHYIIGLND